MIASCSLVVCTRVKRTCHWCCPRAGHDSIIRMLKTHGATLGGQASCVECAAVLCTCVSEGNLPLLR